MRERIHIVTLVSALIAILISAATLLANYRISVVDATETKGRVLALEHRLDMGDLTPAAQSREHFKVDEQRDGALAERVAKIELAITAIHTMELKLSKNEYKLDELQRGLDSVLVVLKKGNL